MRKIFRRHLSMVPFAALQAAASPISLLQTDCDGTRKRMAVGTQSAAPLLPTALAGRLHFPTMPRAESYTEGIGEKRVYLSIPCWVANQ